MGQAKNKRTRFFAEHPVCAFCGGQVPATTIDHIPARTCFPDRAGPEGFEFPACDKCQAATRLDEMAFAMFVRGNDPSDENYRKDEVLSAYRGLKNNLPHLAPFFGISRQDKRRTLREKGLKKPLNMSIDDIPMIGFPLEIDAHLHRYARKIAAALYYREKGKPIGLDFMLWTHWAQATDRKQMNRVLQVANMSPFTTIGSRSNLKFGDRFAYKFDKSDENDLFTAVAQFGKGLVLVMMVADAESAIELEEEGDWIKASAMFS